MIVLIDNCFLVQSSGICQYRMKITEQRAMCSQQFQVVSLFEKVAMQVLGLQFSGSFEVTQVTLLDVAAHLIKHPGNSNDDRNTGK